MTTPLPDARTAARAIKIEVAQGRNPHAEKMNARARRSPSAPSGL